VSLAIHGEALCHIINLYQLYTPTSARLWKESKTYRFPFGTLKQDGEDRHLYTFSIGTLKELSSLRRPFQYSLQDEHGLRAGHLKFDDGVVIAKYFNAIGHGVSDTGARLETTTKTKKPLQDRVKSLLAGMALLNQRNWDQPQLVTPTWINEASSIKRRVTTRGGDDNFLVEHVYKYISERPEIVSRLKTPLPKEELWEEELKSSVKALCMFQDDHFEFVWAVRDMFRSDKNPQFDAIIQQELTEALGKLSELPEGSWGRTLSAIPTQELVNLLKLQHEILNRPIIVLQLGPTELHAILEIRG
jgi:hypothetical protein